MFFMAHWHWARKAGYAIEEAVRFATAALPRWRNARPGGRRVSLIVSKPDLLVTFV